MHDTSYYYTAHYLPSLRTETLSLGSMSTTDTARQKAFSGTTLAGDGLQSKYTNKQLLMDGFITFLMPACLYAAASKTSPPASPLYILTPSHQSPSPLSLHPSVPLSSFIFNPQACLMCDADGHVMRTR